MLRSPLESRRRLARVIQPVVVPVKPGNGKGQGAGQGRPRGGGAGGAIAPANFANVLAQLHFDGANGSTTITDNAGWPGKAWVWTTSGTAALSTTGAKFGTACLLLDGTLPTFVTTPGDAAQSWDFGTGSFCMEFQVNPNAGAGGGSGGDHGVITRRDGANGWTLQLNSTSGAVAFRAMVGGVWTDPFLTASGIVAGQMNHLAVVRSGNTWGIAVNGVWGSTVTNSGALNNMGSLDIRIGAGIHNDAEGRFIGRIDEARVVKGEAIYTPGLAFTPPTRAFADS